MMISKQTLTVHTSRSLRDFFCLIFGANMNDMKKYLILFLSILSAGAFAQKPNKTAVTFSNTILGEDLKQHLFIVASPEMEGRETGTAGQRKAAEYLKQQFSKLGLKPGNNGIYEQFYPVYKDTLIHSELMINGQAYQFGVDYGTSLNSVTTTQLYFSEVVYLSAADTTTDVKGKVVMLAGRQPGFGELNKLYQRQPAAVIIAQQKIDQQSSSRIGRMYLNLFRSKQSPLSIRITEDLAKALLGDDFAKAKEQSLETKTVSTELSIGFRKGIQTIQASNVLGVIEGTDKKDEWVIISAHYDHVGIINGQLHPGADDDGSGTVGVLELAEAFMKAKAAGKGPRRTILFLLVSGEEKGLWGSEYYCKHPVYPLNKTTIDINIDMIGRKDDKLNSIDSNNHVYLIGDDKLSTELTRYTDSINTLYTKLILDRKYNDPKDPNRLYFRSDHYNFARNGVPIVFFFDGIHKDYHKPSDTPDKINYDLYEKRVRLVFFLAWEAANRNNMFRRDKPLSDIPGR